MAVLRATHGRAPEPDAAPPTPPPPPRAKEADPYARLSANPRALAARNPIRAITDALPQPATALPVVSLAVGDPTAFGLTPPPRLCAALAACTADATAHGYPQSVGRADARAAIAAHINDASPPPTAQLRADDVLLTAGCSQALEHALRALVGPSTRSVLVPNPGFPLYETLCTLHGLEARRYPLRADANFAPDVEAWRDLADDTTVAVVVCTPGNPTGHVSSAAELGACAAAAADLGLVVLADEVYASLVYAPGRTFVPLASVSDRAPVLSLGAVSKGLFAPGWRLGWIGVHDRGGVLKASGVLKALHSLCQVSLGPCSLVQCAVARYLGDAFVPGSEAAAARRGHYDAARSALRERSEAAARLAGRAGEQSGKRIFCRCPDPAGAMYLWLRLAPDHGLRGLEHGVDVDVAFARALLRDCAVVVLPGTCFGAPGYVRISTAATVDALSEAFRRIEAWVLAQREGGAAAPV